jgi:hypothetical protein
MGAATPRSTRELAACDKKKNCHNSAARKFQPIQARQRRIRFALTTDAKGEKTMSKLLQEGGLPIWFVLLFGLLTLGAAIAYAIKPQLRRLQVMRGLGAATLFSTLSGTAGNIGMVFHAMAGVDGRHPDLNLETKDGPLMLMLGLGESMSCLILGFSFLCLAGLFYAAGAARAPSPTHS